MTFLYIVIAYLLGLAAMKLAQEMRDPNPMRIRDYVVSILFGWILVPLVAYMRVMMCFFIGLETSWNFIKKAW